MGFCTNTKQNSTQIMQSDGPISGGMLILFLKIKKILINYIMIFIFLVDLMTQSSITRTSCIFLNKVHFTASTPTVQTTHYQPHVITRKTRGVGS